MPLKSFLSFFWIINVFVILLAIGCTGDSGKNTAPKGSEKNPIIMGFNPAESSDVILTNADALAQVIEKQTGYKIKTYVAQSYPALVTALQHEHVDFAWLPPFAYVQAEEVADAEVLLKAVRDGQPYYFGAIIVRSDSPFEKIEDLKGKSIAWASETSTSGRIFPLAALMKLGYDPETFFSDSKIAGGHDAALLAVFHGQVDAAATFAADNEGIKGSWTQFLDEDQQGSIKPIFFTEPIPSDTMSTSSKFRKEHPEIVEKITETVKSLSEAAETRELLKVLYNIDAMVDATSEDYNPVREAASLLGIDVEGPKKKSRE
ncbi:MAG: phosphate/phosphite/phosphonate ABC transporter substrate-binding protein [bacterium]